MSSAEDESVLSVDGDDPLGSPTSAVASSWNGPEWVKREDGTLFVCIKKVNEWIKGPQYSKLFAPEKKKVDGTIQLCCAALCRFQKNIPALAA